MKKKEKKVWTIKVDGDGLFFMENEEGTIVWPTTKLQSRFKMAEHAFEKGATDVHHNYDLLKYP